MRGGLVPITKLSIPIYRGVSRNGVGGFLGGVGKLMQGWEKEVFWGRVTEGWGGVKLSRAVGVGKTKPGPQSQTDI